MGVAAAGDAASAENALARVAHDGGGDVVINRFGSAADKATLARAGDLGCPEQLAAAVFVALLAVLGVVAEQQLHARAARGDGARGGDDDLHPFAHGIDAGGDEAGAGAALAMVERAEGRDLIAAIARGLEDGHALLNLIVLALNLDVHFTHNTLPPFSDLADRAEAAGGEAHAAADALCLVDLERRLARNAADRLNRALARAERALFAFLRVDAIADEVLTDPGGAFLSTMWARYSSRKWRMVELMGFAAV